MRAEPAAELPPVSALGRRRNLFGDAISASQGVVGREELAARPQLRTGDLVEYVPCSKTRSAATATRAGDIGTSTPVPVRSRHRLFLRLAPAGRARRRVDDLHFHPFESRALRLALRYEF